LHYYFFLGRLVFGSWLFYNGLSIFPQFINHCLENGLTNSLILGSTQIGLGIGTRALNLYWFVLIVSKVIQAVTGKSSAKKSKAQQSKPIPIPTSSSTSAQVVPLISEESDSTSKQGLVKRNVSKPTLA